MKRIFLLRHGKSDWNAPYSTDHERPLKGRGVRAARTIGRFLAETDEEPDVIVSSSAVRALSTAELAAEAGSWRCEIRVAMPRIGLLRSLLPASITYLCTAHEARSRRSSWAREYLTG